MIKKRFMSLALLSACTLVLTACSSSSDSKNTSSSSSSIETAKATSSSSKNTTKDSYKDGTLTVNGVEYKITEAKTYSSASGDGQKVVALYLDITNHNSKPADLLVDYNPHAYIHAEQKSESSIKKLNVGVPDIDENGNSVEQERQDVMSNDKVTSGSTVQGIMFFELVNDNPVTIIFSDSNYDTIGEKTYNLQ